MADIHIHREHHLGLPQARKTAFAWAEQAEQQLDLACTYEEGDTEDLLTFERAGVKGSMRVDADCFELRARLGLLFAAFKGQIESEINQQFDALLAPRHTARKTAKPAAAKTTKAEKAAKAPQPSRTHKAHKA